MLPRSLSMAAVLLSIALCVASVIGFANAAVALPVRHYQPPRPHRISGPAVQTAGVRGYRIDLAEEAGVTKSLFDFAPEAPLSFSPLPRLADLSITPAAPIPVFFLPGDTDLLISDSDRCYRLVAPERPITRSDSFAAALRAGDPSAAREIAAAASRSERGWRAIVTVLGSEPGDAARAVERLDAARTSHAYWSRLNLLNALALTIRDGRTAEALTLLGRIESNPGIPEELCLQAASIAITGGDPALARRALERIADREPEAALILAVLDARANALDRAAVHLERVLAIDVTRHDAHFLRGLVFFESGNREAALYALANAAALAEMIEPEASGRYRAIADAMKTAAPPIDPAVVIPPPAPPRPTTGTGDRQR